MRQRLHPEALSTCLREHLAADVRTALDTSSQFLAEYEQPTPAPAPNLTEPPTRSTAWAYEPRNLGGGHTVVTTQFRPCKSDDDQPT